MSTNTPIRTIAIARTSLMDDLGSASDDPVMEEDVDREADRREEVPNFVSKATYEYKLRELLHKISSNEIKLYVDATKEFIKLLKGNDGGQLLHLYVQTSLNFSELLGDWKVRQGKPGISYILSLISVILSHPDGMYRQNDKERVSVSRIIDKFCQSFIEEKLEVVYKELNSKEGKRQNAALLLMASIVRRGSGLASEVAKSFNFKLQTFSKLAEYKIRKKNDKEMRHSTRKAFVNFSMSFLEVAKPGLLRWVLQQKEMYSGVLRGLGSDDDETVTYVLSTLRDRVLTERSLVPPGLRSVLFGSVTLEQLAGISGRENGGAAAEMAHSVLVMVCTDPCNGLMPDWKRHSNPLRGNPKRLLDLMKKLKAAEIGYHRDLLLAIVRGRPSFGSAYLEELPYNLEDYASPIWFATVSLAANLISSMSAGLHFCFLNSEVNDSLSLDSGDVQNIINCISPRSFNRSVINKGLLHSDFLIKNGTLRLLLETLKLLDSFFSLISLPCPEKQMTQRLASLKQEIQNEIRSLLPDPQVLLTLLSSLSSHARTDEKSSKRQADGAKFPEHGGNRTKKLKRGFMDEDVDILVPGINQALEIASLKDNEHSLDEPIQDELDNGKDFINVFAELWGFGLGSMPLSTLQDAEIFFLSKLLDVLKTYILTIPSALEGSFEFFMNLLSNPLSLPSNLQISLLSLLVEYIKWSPGSRSTIRTPPLMYKHLQTFINLLIFSSNTDIKVQACNLARAAMLSTGAFDTNLREVVAWFLFLPGYNMVNSTTGVQGVEVLGSFSSVVISFLCDAISTLGNNLFRYWDVLRKHAYCLEEFRDVSPDFSPLIICVLQKCVRVLNSESGAFSLPEKSLISLYVSDTLKFIMQTQVDAGLLSALIRSVLSKGLEDHCSLVDDTEKIFCEWSPLKNLLLFAESILHQRKCCFFSFDQAPLSAGRSFSGTIDEIKKFIQSGQVGEKAGMRKAFISAILCTSSDEIVMNFPAVMTTSRHLQVPNSFLSSIIFLDQSLLADVLKLWPKVAFTGLKMAASMIYDKSTKDDAFSEEIQVDNLGFDDGESSAAAAAAFCFFLRQVPFHVLFPAIISVGVLNLLESSDIGDLLLAKLSECSRDCIISELRLLLFWFYQIRSSYITKPSPELEQRAEICYILVKHELTRQIVLNPHSEHPTIVGLPVLAENVREVAETIFCHPAVMASVTHPLSYNGDLIKGDFGDSLESFMSFCGQRVHKIDNHVLDILTTTFACFLSPSAGQHAVLEDGASKEIAKAFNTMVQALNVELRDKFDQCIRTKDLLPLLPLFYALHTLIGLISPFELFELAHWIFGRLDVNGLSTQNPSMRSALSIGLCIAHDAFEILSTFLQKPTKDRAQLHIFWEKEEKNFNFNLIQEIYVKVCQFATDFDLDLACICLLNAMNSLHSQKYKQPDTLHPLSLALSMLTMSTPIEIISHCIYSTSMTKAKLVLLLVEMSPQHLSVFGHLLSGVLKEDFHLKKRTMEETCDFALSDAEFIMLLPSALVYLNSVFMKFEKHYYKHFTHIPSFYSRTLLNGFCNWKSFVSRYVFEENYEGVLLSSVEDLVNLVHGSTLGKAICMLQYHFILGGEMKMKERLKLFNSILTCSGAQDELLDLDVDEIKFYSLNESLNFINKIIGKISLCQILLFPKNNPILPLPKEAGGSPKEISLGMVSNKEGQSRMRFLQCLVVTWQCMVKKFPLASDGFWKGKDSCCLQLYKYLELFILRMVFELTSEMRKGLIKLQHLPFFEQLMRSSLLYRFEDPATLKILCSILNLLSEEKFSCGLYLQLLVAHSQFAPTIHLASESFGSQTGVFVKPMSSILRFLATSHPNSKKDLQTTKLCLKRLQIIKLLRVLLRLQASQDGFDSQNGNGVNLKELHLLLLSSYGATLSEIDMEIYNLMLEIESVDKSVAEGVAEIGYLWGNSALKIRKEQALEQHRGSKSVADIEAVQEHRRSQFRENLPIDPKMCVKTVLHFPYKRTTSDGPLSLNCLQPDNVNDMHETHILGVENAQLYDPVFILRFSIHSLSMGYIEPVEFSGLGLLAVAFVSMSSPDLGMRKLGYESLARYKNELEKSQKKKDIMRLRLLLTYLQNGIEEPWQRIPSVIALFAAESSFILLDPSHDHYTALSKHLMHSPRVNMKCIPLFHTLFQSNSVNLRTERLWMIRLVCAGLNLDDDSHIFIRNSIIEALLSFYASPLSDNESKELILRIVKKSVKLHKMALYLVEHCGLIAWLSSILSTYSGMLNENPKSFFAQQFGVVIEVVAYVVASRNIIEWLQNYALEQLMGLAIHLYKLLVAGLGLLKEDVALVDSVIHILMATLKISHKRKIYQPHLTLAFNGLFQIYQACRVFNTAGSSANSDSGLRAILMSTPPVDIFHMNQEKLSSFLMWAVSTAMKSDSGQIFHVKASNAYPTIMAEEDSWEESLMSKLQRWLIASVILGKLSQTRTNLNTKFSKSLSSETLQTFLEHVESGFEESNKCKFDCEEVLAGTIFYLQQLIGLNCVVLPSVVSALGLLLPFDASKNSGSDSILGYKTPAASLCSKIRCPTEVNSAWRWSFYQPWKDLSSELSDSQKMEEHHACQTLLLTFSTILGRKSLDSHFASYQKIEDSAVFKWERSIIETEQHNSGRCN